jgi:hypothetical protein
LITHGILTPLYGLEELPVTLCAIPVLVHETVEAIRRNVEVEVNASGIEVNTGGVEALAGGVEALAGGGSLTFNSVPTPTG